MSISILVLTLVIVLAALISYYMLRTNTGTKTGYKDLYSEGLDLLVTGRLKDAYQNFKVLVQRDTNNIKAYLKLGQVAREGGNPQQALKIHNSLSLRKNLTHFEQIELAKNLALDYEHLEKYKDAIDRCQQLLKLEKNNEWALTHLVKFYRSIEDWGSAGENLSRLQKSTGRPNQRKIALYKIQEGRIVLKAADYKKARTLFEAALKIDKDIGAAYYFIGNSFAKESDKEHNQAESLYKNSKKSSKEEKKYLDAMGDARALLGKAITNWIQFMEAIPPQAWMVLPRLKDALFALDRYNEIENILKKVLKTDSDNTEALAGLAEFYHNRGDSQEAIELIDSAMEKDDQSLMTHLIKLKLKMNTPQTRALSKGLDKIIEIISSDKYSVYRFEEDPDIKWLYEHTNSQVSPD